MEVVEEVATDAELREDQEFQQRFARQARKLTDRLSYYARRAKNLQTTAKKLKKKLGTTTTVGLIDSLEAIQEELDEIQDGWATARYEAVSIALGGRYTPEQVRGWCEDAVEMGCAHPRIGPSLIEDLMYERVVPVAPFLARLREIRYHVKKDAEAPEEYGWGRSDVEKDPNPAHGMIKEAAVALGTDYCSVYKVLGTAKRTNRPGSPGSLSLFITYEQASRLAKAWAMSPQEAGI